MHIVKLRRGIIKSVIILSAVLMCILLIQAIMPVKEIKSKLTDILLAQPVFAQGSEIPKILTEYADSVLTMNLLKPEQLNQQAAGVSPRILVEYADSILNINLERPTAILPTPSQPTPTTTTPPGPTSAPTPAQTPSPQPAPTPKPDEVSVYLYVQKTDVNIGEDIVLNLSAVNLITKPSMTVQLILKAPSGMSVTSTGFIEGGGGQYTATFEVEPGGIKQIEVHIMTNQAGNFNVVGDICYYFGGDKTTAQYRSVNLPVSVKEAPPKTPPSSTAPAGGSENKGLSGTMIAVIIGICTATVGGVLARIIYGRMRAPVSVKSGTSDGFRPPPKNEQPTLKKEAKDIPPLVPDRVPEEKVLDIKEGQKGISYQGLFGAYVREATLITIQDPYIHAPYQIANLREFCEILDTSKGSVKVKLTTSRDEFPESQQENRLNELKMGLLNEHIEFDFAFGQTIHDRWIETDTGWRIMLGRGLDIFQPGIGFSDQKKRKCKATTITYTRLKIA